MPSMYVSSVAYAAVTQWAASTAYNVGDLRRQLAAVAVGSERVFRCTTAGTSGGTEPTWVLTAGATTNDNTAVWTEVTGQQAYQASGAWGAPHARVDNASAAGWMAAGDDCYIGNNHAESASATSVTVLSPGTAASPCRYLCVNVSGAVPPGPADIVASPSGSIATTGANSINIRGIGWVEGLILSAGSGASAANINLLTGVISSMVLKNCSLVLNNTSASSVVSMGGTTNATQWGRLINTTFTFGAVGQRINLSNVVWEWEDTPNALVGANIPTTFSGDVTGGSHYTCIFKGVDLSAAGSGKTLFSASAPQVHGRVYLQDCKLSSLVTMTNGAGQLGGLRIVTTRSGSAGVNYNTEQYQYPANQTVATDVVRTNGASDGTTPLSWRIATTANAKFHQPFTSIPLSIWNAVSGATVNVTVQGLVFQAALPKNDEIWFEVQYLGSASTSLASFARGQKSNMLASGAAWDASGDAWDTAATAWAASTAYPVGTIRKLASNPGRLFRVESISGTGTSAGSEPAGFASALDGTTVVDNPGANQITWRACTRFSMTVPLSSPQPAQIGTIYVYPYAAAASTTFYLDPKILLG